MKIDVALDKRIERNIEVEYSYLYYVEQMKSMASDVSTSASSFDISSLDYDTLVGVVSTEDIERLHKAKPQTIQAAVRAGVKQAAIAHIYSAVMKNMAGNLMKG